MVLTFCNYLYIIVGKNDTATVPKVAVSFVPKKRAYKPRAKKGIMFIIYNNNILNLSAFDFAVVVVVDQAKEDPLKSKESPLRQDTLDAAFARTLAPVSATTVPEPAIAAAISAWQSVVSASAPVSKGPGRPAGAKNKATSSAAQGIEKRPGDSKFPKSSWSLTISKVATDPLNKDVKKDLLNNMKQFLDDCCIRGFLSIINFVYYIVTEVVYKYIIAGVMSTEVGKRAFNLHIQGVFECYFPTNESKLLGKIILFIYQY